LTQTYFGQFCIINDYWQLEKISMWEN
jgi:hypothetical protein